MYQPATMKAAGASEYRRVAVETASPVRLVLMLYDGAIRFLKQAREAVDAGDLTHKGHYLGRCLAVIEELMGSLNLEAAPEIAENLLGLYLRVIQLLSKANLSSDPLPMDEAAKLLVTLRDGWREAAMNEGKQQEPGESGG